MPGPRSLLGVCMAGPKSLRGFGRGGISRGWICLGGQVYQGEVYITPPHPGDGTWDTHSSSTDT